MNGRFAAVGEDISVAHALGNPPVNVKSVCQFTLMCERQGGELVFSDYDPIEPGPQTDIHPSNKGYRKIANTILNVVDDYELLDD